MLTESNRQFVTLVDPKGLRNPEGPDDDKIRLGESIKGIEQRLGDRELTPNSCIAATTSLDRAAFWGQSTMSLEKRHVVLQDDPGSV